MKASQLDSFTNIPNIFSNAENQMSIIPWAIQTQYTQLIKWITKDENYNQK